MQAGRAAGCHVTLGGVMLLGLDSCLVHDKMPTADSGVCCLQGQRTAEKIVRRPKLEGACGGLEAGWLYSV